MSSATHTGHETRDFRVRPIVVFALVLGLVVFLSLFLMWRLFDDLRAERRRAETAPVPIAISELPPQPRLQIDPGDDLKRLRAEEERLLNQTAWIDRERGLLRIPIEQAMKRLVAQESRPKAEKGPQ